MIRTTPRSILVGLLAIAAGCEATDPTPADGAEGDLPALYINEIMASSATYLDAAGSATDWVEIFNAEAAPVDLGGMYLCDDHYVAEGVAGCHLVPTGFAAETTVAAGGFIVFDFNGDVAEGPREVPLKLGAGGDAVFLLDASGRVVDDVAYGAGDGLDVVDVSFGRVADGQSGWASFGAGLDGAPTPGAPNGSAGAEPTGPSAPVLGDAVLDPVAPTFADRVVVTVEASDPDGDLERVTLSYAVDGAPLNEVAMTSSGAGWSATIGPFADGGVLRYTVAAVDRGGRETRSAQASVTVAAPSGPRPLINEVMAVNASFPDETGAFPDWVEVYNAGDQPVDLAGMYLTDDHYGDGVDGWYAIPAGDASTMLAPGAFVVFWFDKAAEFGPRHVSEKLSGEADAVYLVGVDGETVVDALTWDAETGLDFDDVSLGRAPDGGDSWTLFGPDEASAASPGASNVP